MSSYQFVNSLTSCYGQRSQDSSSQDYYTPQVQTYGGGCYSGPGSPVQQYGPYPQHNVPHLQNGDHHFNSCSQNRLNHPNQSQSPRTPTPSVTPVPSCKYAEPSAASPQDLSTSASHPPPAGSPESRTSPQPPRQHPSPTHSQGVAPTQQTTSQQASPQQTQGPQDSSSPQAAQQGQQKSAYPSTPPQIYPWMRKVHVGQKRNHNKPPLLVGARPNFGRAPIADAFARNFHKTEPNSCPCKYIQRTGLVWAQQAAFTSIQTIVNIREHRCQ
ncbi:uncharacterized protein CDAR_290091 [Caerostris darwini]|uniref:Sex combs reduced n=1 Tax=Caerostris darwini TaxID=1538125 RepID=A0AAV4WWW3_9ARAC|nr:uncharacterized protein CDAR_290091 [Caerostris darwini]